MARVCQPEGRSCISESSGLLESGLNLHDHLYMCKNTVM